MVDSDEYTLIALILIIVTILAASTGAPILPSVPRLTDVPFGVELPRLLVERGLSQRKLAQMIDVNPSHLSRVLRGDETHPSTDLIRRITLALDLHSGYFPELREAAVIEGVKSDPKLRDRLYKRLELDKGA